MPQHVNMNRKRQLGDIRCDPSRLIFAEQLGGRASPRLCGKKIEKRAPLRRFP
jgi:hypothetical protein